MSASTSASPPKRIRPNFEAENLRIRLRPDVFHRWFVKKDSLGFTHKAHSQFAVYLLDICEEPTDQQMQQSSESGECFKRLWSTSYCVCLHAII